MGEIKRTTLPNRREFLGVSAAAGVSMITARGAENQIEPAPGSESGWFSRPMRWAQLTLVENDPGRFDPDFWLDYFRRTHSDAACLSAGGCVAYYPTRIPLHHRSAWLGESDPFGYMVKGCREMGMVVLARTDSHAIHQDAFDAHPEWAAVGADGNPRRHWSSPEMWVACALGPYSFEFMTQVHREIMSTYSVDGIFTNRWAGSGMCYCQSCRRNFRGYSGMDLPVTEDPHDPARRKFLVWEQERLFELWRLWDGVIRSINPDARYIANAGGGALSDLDMKRIGEMADILFADRQGRRGLMAPWANGKNGKEYRATMGMKPIGGIFTVGVEEPYRWKDSVQSEAELRIWVADGIAHGLRPWFTKFSGTVHDPRWFPVVEKIYKWHHQAEKYLRNLRPLANVAVVYSQQTATYYGGPDAWSKVESHTLGIYQALVEARIPFEMVHDGLLDEDHLEPYALLILPNIAALSDKQCEQLRRYVAGGGNLLATFETSLYDEWGNRRSDFGLSDLFGVHFAGSVEGPMKNSYLAVTPDPLTGQYHPLVKGLEESRRIINGTLRVDVEWPEELLNAPLKLIPPYPDLPMEKVYPRIENPRTPGISVRDYGKGRIVYFPWDIDRTFWEVLCVDHLQLLDNGFRWALRIEPPVSVTGPGVLDISVWEQESSITVHLVNLTNPMMMKGPFRDLIPVGEQTIRLRLPIRGKPSRIHLLVRQEAVPFEVDQSSIVVRVPSVLDHEVVAIDLNRS